MESNNNILPFPNAARGAPAGRRLIPARLKDARAAKRLNQAELGTAIGKTRQAISAYELGEKSPEAATLAAIATVLDQPIAYFTASDRESFGGFGPRFFRATGPETKRRNLMCDAYAGWEVQIARYVDDLVNYPPVVVPSLTPSDPGGGYADEEIEEAAAECRSRWGLGYGPLSTSWPLRKARVSLRCACGWRASASRHFRSGMAHDRSSFSHPRRTLLRVRGSMSRTRSAILYSIVE